MEKLEELIFSFEQELSKTWHEDALTCDGARDDRGYTLPCPCPSHR